jgi:hypothetical protein
MLYIFCFRRIGGKLRKCARLFPQLGTIQKLLCYQFNKAKFADTTAQIVYPSRSRGRHYRGHRPLLLLRLRLLGREAQSQA